MDRSDRLALAISMALLVVRCPSTRDSRVHPLARSHPPGACLRRAMVRATALVLALPALVRAACPFGGHGEMPAGHPMIRQPAPEGYVEAATKLDWGAVKSDLLAFFKTSDDSWPSDYNNYGPFYVRLAWHCSGSYRTSDGRGGCDGGRQRFLPEGGGFWGGLTA